MKIFKVFTVLLLMINVGCLEPSNMLDTDTYQDVGTDTDSSKEMDILPSSGCGRAPILGGEKELLVGEMLRTYLVDIPEDYDSNFSYPIVFAFHGMGMTGKSFRLYNGLNEHIGDDAVVVHPDAAGNFPVWDTDGGQDLLFFDAMLDELSEGLCIDSARVFATGHSNGASFSNTLGCYRGDELRAIAPVSGRIADDRDEESCNGRVAVWLAHGENDFVVPFNLGKQARDYWMTENYCDNSSISVSPDACIEYNGCDDEYPVQWCTHNNRHGWPYFASEGISDFFRSF